MCPPDLKSSDLDSSSDPGLIAERAAGSKYQILAREIVQFLRGEKSQRQMSQDLGFTFNQVGKWESGFTQIKWGDFIQIAQVAQVPMERYFRNFFVHNPVEFSAALSIKALSRSLPTHFAQLGHTAARVKRWTDGVSQPDLSEVLQIIDQRPLLLLGWLSLFIDCTRIASLAPAVEIFTRRLEAVAAEPLCVYVNAALHLSTYQSQTTHNEELLADAATCTVAELRSTLNLLLNAEIISREGEKFCPCPFDFSFSAAAIPKLRGLTKYTTELLAHRYSTLPAKTFNYQELNFSLSSVRVTAVSQEAARKISDLIMSFQSEVARVVAQDSRPKTGLQILLVHSVDSRLNRPESP